MEEEKTIFKENINESASNIYSLDINIKDEIASFEVAKGFKVCQKC